VGDERTAQRLDGMARHYGSLEEAAEAGRIQFRSAARRAELIAAYDALCEAECRADDEATAWREAEEMCILRAAGLD